MLPSPRSSDEFRPESWSVPCHRRRIYQVDDAHWIEVRDTLQREFIGEGFPRGTLLVSISNTDERKLMRLLSTWMAQRTLERDGAWDVVQAPAMTRRCRLIQITDPAGLLPNGEVVEIWDFVEEPCEYREEMPQGTTLCKFQDFSTMFVFKQIRQFRRDHGIVSVRRWAMPMTA